MIELKTWSDYFIQMATGAKPFDLRYDDGKNFKPGDTLYLRDYCRDNKIYSGKALIAPITYVMPLKNFIPSVDGNWMILGIPNVKLVYNTDNNRIISAYTSELDKIIKGERCFCFVHDQNPEYGQTITIAQNNSTRLALATISDVCPINLTSDTLTRKSYIVSIRNVVYKG